MSQFGSIRGLMKRLNCEDKTTDHEESIDSYDSVCLWLHFIFKVTFVKQNNTELQRAVAQSVPSNFWASQRVPKFSSN